jgi:putative ABC transport system substrate-binding protein
MRRRAVIIAVAAAPAMTWNRPILGQTKKQPVVIGVLSFGSGTPGTNIAAFREELAARGWKEGAQVILEVLHAQGDNERLPALAQALAAKNPAVIVAATGRVVEAAAKAAPRTPIVMIQVGDPIAFGFAKSLSRPGGMITGLSNIATDISSKFVELLVAAVPGVRRIGFLLDTANPGAKLHQEWIQRSTAHHSVQATIGEVKRREDIEQALQSLSKRGVQALASMPSPMLSLNRKQILQFASTQRWPVVSSAPGWVRDGALLSYAAPVITEYKRAAYYVDRILRGTKPAELPIELPTTFEMAVNLKTAKALGLTLPPEIMVRATEVVQ